MPPGQIRPPVPGFFERIRFITFYAFNPCDAPFSLYVEVSKAPVGELVAFLILPDLENIVQTFFTPKGLRTGRHGRKGRRGGKGWQGIPDLDEEIAKRLPGAEEFHGRTVGSATHFLFEFAGVADRVHWNLAVVDKVSETLYQSLYGIVSYKTDKCPNLGRMLRTLDYNPIIDSGGSFQPFPCGPLSWIHHLVSPHQYICEVPAGTYIVTVSMIVKNPFPGEDAALQLAVWDIGGDHAVTTSGFVHIPDEDFIPMSLDGTVIGPGAVGIRALSQHHVEARQISWQVLQAGK